MKILYVEDDQVDRKAVIRELSRLAPDIDVQTAPTITEARHCLEQPAQYDLLLVDMGLPDGSGFDLLLDVREYKLPLAVVILTGSGDEEAAVAALKAGANDYVVKREGYLSRLPMLLEQALKNFQAEAVRQSQPLLVLYAEPNADDSELTQLHLIRYAPHIHLEVVEMADAVIQRIVTSCEEHGGTCHYDVLLLDYRLPGVNALDLVRVLQQEHRIEMPIVLVTGHGDEELAIQALRLGITDYLVKNPGYLFKLPGILENVYHQAQLEREQVALRESETRFRRLAGGIGHELRHPLGVISNSIYYLRELFSNSDDTVQEYLSIIAFELDTANRIVSDLLNASQIKPLHQSHISAALLVEHVLEKQVPPADIRVDLDIPSDLPELFADVQQIELVLRHLLLNAYQAMPEGGRLTVGSKQLPVSSAEVPHGLLNTDNCLLITVQDTGCGISRENMLRIFEPLFTTKTRGIGLGLTICQTLMDANGGIIQVGSQEGQGTEITLCFPCKEVSS